MYFLVFSLEDVSSIAENVIFLPNIVLLSVIYFLEENGEDEEEKTRAKKGADGRGKNNFFPPNLAYNARILICRMSQEMGLWVNIPNFVCRISGDIRFRWETHNYIRWLLETLPQNRGVA